MSLTVSIQGPRVIRTTDYYPFGAVAKEWVNPEYDPKQAPPGEEQYVTELSTGDIQVIGVNSDEPDVFAFSNKVSIAEGTEIHFTDKGWQSGSHSFRGYEGVITYTVPTGGLLANSVILGGLDQPNFTGTSGFMLAQNGDQITVFQGEVSAPTLLFSLSYGDAWVSDDESLNSNTSHLPSALTAGVDAINIVSTKDNHKLNGDWNAITSLDVANVGNWVSSNTAYTTQAVAAQSSTNGYILHAEQFYRYGYQGQYAEMDTITGWNSFQLRMYDPLIGRWLAVDPARQFASPYNGMGNDPVNVVDPTGGCETCPDETYIPLANHAYNAQVGDVTENGWVAENVIELESGFRGVFYSKLIDGKSEFIFASAGTQDLSPDGVNDALQLLGFSDQYTEAINLAMSLDGSGLDGMSFTGHSLGGGLASAMALTTGAKAVTFNAAGLSPFTRMDALVANFLTESPTADITAYVVEGEIVSYAQGLIKIQAEGNIKTLPVDYSILYPVRITQRVQNHMMEVVIQNFPK